MRVSLSQGAYTARSLIASAQRCVNLYPEKNPADQEAPYTHYSCPGLRPLVSLSAPAPGRGLYWANTGQLFYAAGDTLYLVTPSWALSKVGTIEDGVTPVSMMDNGSILVLVDGTTNGYQVNLATMDFSQISEDDNAPPVLGGGVYAFYGADRVDILDGYFLLNQSGTRNFYSSYNNEAVFDALYFAAKNGYSDNLVSVIVSRREIWLIGERTTEIWYDAGSSAFPFQIMPGPFVQHGCSAKYSVAQLNGGVYWLSQDQAGNNVILRGYGYDARRISTHAIESAMAGYSTTSDAVGYCYQKDGHAFYMLTFPTADATWCYDEASELWHQRVWTDTDGVEHRHRSQCHAYAYGTNVVADWKTGQLYAFDSNVYTDAGAPMVFRRGWPHLMADGKRVHYSRFALDIEPGTSSGTSGGTGSFVGGGPRAFPMLNNANARTPTYTASPIYGGPPPSTQPVLMPGVPDTSPKISLRWSDTRGLSWSNPVEQSLGATGQFVTQPQWRRLGMARDRVFEVFGEMSGRIAINGAFIDAEPLGS